MKFNYTKMSGAGNTFIMVDGKDLPEDIDLAALAPEACSEAQEHGGADGFIAIYPWDGGDFEMRYYNRDGSTGMMCGNGGRCAVRFAVDHGYVADPDGIGFINAGVPYTARITARGVKLHFPDPRQLRLEFKLQLLGAARTCHWADVGTPHAVMLVDEIGASHAQHLSHLDLNEWGPKLRGHAEFAPEGANANFVEMLPDGSGISLRTFERGVEAETGACGTGAVASAIVVSTLRGLKPPIAVTTSSGDTLWVDFRFDNGVARDVTLEGNAETVMEGEMECGVKSAE
jgi:diaminopimelate epimerase